MYRINPETGEVLVPHLFDDGAYGAADPSLGNRRHHIANRVVARSIEELKGFLSKGWPIWMSIRGTRDRRLISKGIIDADPPRDRSVPFVNPEVKVVAARGVAGTVENRSIVPPHAPVARAIEPVASSASRPSMKPAGR